MGLWAAFSFLFFNGYDDFFSRRCVAIIINIDKSSSVFCVFHLETSFISLGGGGVLSIVPDFAGHKNSRGSKLVAVRII